MIDYGKLKEAHDLALLYTERYEVPVFIRVLFTAKVGHRSAITLTLNVGDEHTTFFHVDALVDKLVKLHVRLHELTKPKSKYNVGQTVWRVNDEYLPESFVITDIDYDSDDMYLDDDGNWWFEIQLYPSKKALIEAQIAYWEKFLAEGNVLLCNGNPPLPCEHTPQHEMYFSNPGLYKCGKCGKFYR